MIEQINQRISELKAEFEKGQKALMEIEEKRALLQNTLQRILGAVQVLEDLKSKQVITEEQVQEQE